MIPGSLIVVAMILVGVVVSLPDRDDALPDPEVLPVNVRVQTVTPRPEFADTFDLSAVVEPESVVEVAAEVAGRIERFGRRTQSIDWRGRLIPAGATIDEGEPVSVGDPIVYLNTDLLQARYDRAEAQFEYDQREYRRILDLRESGTTSQTELDDAGTRRDISRALFEEARRELQRATIVAPLSGILNRLPMELGEYATSGDPVAKIVDIDSVKVVVDVPERDVHYLKVGQTATVSVRPPVEQEFTGSITYISELADKATRTSRLEITVANRAHTLRSGQIVRARLTRRVLTNVIMIPLSSVIPLEHGRVVYVVDREQHAARREVELGFIKGRNVRVIGGLEPGERLIVVGHRFVGPGQPVKIITAEPEP